MNKKVRGFFQSIIQIFSSIPATAFFPILLMWCFRHNITNLNLPAVVLMMLSSQWYLLFNIIAGVSSIPDELQTTSSLLPLSRFQRYKTLFLPSIFPYLITGLITVYGGCWNASIIAEYSSFSGKIYSIKGLGSLIVKSTSSGNYELLFASTLSMIIIVVLLNRLLWRRLYKIAEERYTI